MKLKKEIAIRSLKIVDIGYITILQFALALFLAKQCDKLFDYLFETHNDCTQSKKNTAKQAFEVILMLWIIGIVIYIARNIIEFIPSPLHGISGFDHYRVSELHDLPIFIFVFLMFQTHLTDKLTFYYKYLFA